MYLLLLVTAPSELQIRSGESDSHGGKNHMEIFRQPFTTSGDDV